MMDVFSILLGIGIGACLKFILPERCANKENHVSQLINAENCIEDYQLFGDGDLDRAKKLIRKVTDELQTQ